MNKRFYEKCNTNGTLNIKAPASTAEETDRSLNTQPLEPQTTVFCTVTHWYTHITFHLKCTTFYFFFLHEMAV